MQKNVEKKKQKLDFSLNRHNWMFPIGAVILNLVSRLYLGDGLLPDLISYGSIGLAIAGVIVMNQIQAHKNSQ